MIRTRHACKTFLISRQGPTERGAVSDPKELQAQQVLTERPGEPPPTFHSENKTQEFGAGSPAVRCGNREGCLQHRVNDSRHG